MMTLPTVSQSISVVPDAVVVPSNVISAVATKPIASSMFDDETKLVAISKVVISTEVGVDLPIALALASAAAQAVIQVCIHSLTILSVFIFSLCNLMLLILI